MAKLSENQQAALDVLKRLTAPGTGVEVVSKAAWKKGAPPGVSIHAPPMVKTGTVVAVLAAVSTNGKIIELYKPAPADPVT